MGCPSGIHPSLTARHCLSYGGSIYGYNRDNISESLILFFIFLNYPHLFMNNVKQKIQSILNQLPDDCSIEDIQYHLYVLEKVRLGLQSADIDNTLKQNEVEGLLTKWLIE
jgi:hypothetical protein